MRQRLTYYGYRIGVGVIGLLPEPVVRRLGSGVGRLFWFVAGGRRRMAMRHMNRVLGDDANHAKASRAMFAAYGRYWAETLWFRPSRFESVRRNLTFTGREHFDAATALGRPIVAALPHLGNWEMAAAASKDLSVRVTAVAEALANGRVLDWFVSYRTELSIDVVVAEKGSQVIRTLIERLHDGRLVALVADRDLSGRGIEVEFFGEKTTLPGGPAALALKTGAVLTPVASYFKPGRGHELVIEAPLVEPEHGTQDEKIAAMTQQLAEAFERQILRAPTQWHLLQPNWPSDRESQ